MRAGPAVIRSSSSRGSEVSATSTSEAPGAPAAITARPLGRRVFLILKSGMALSACAI